MPVPKQARQHPVLHLVDHYSIALCRHPFHHMIAYRVTAKQCQIIGIWYDKMYQSISMQKADGLDSQLNLLHKNRI